MVAAERERSRSLRMVESRSPSVTRAIGILEELARRRDAVSLTELARSLDLPKSTVVNLCAALEAARMIRRVGGWWALDHKVVELGHGFLSTNDRVGEFQRLCRTLPAAAEETLLLAVLDDLDVVHLARHDGSQPIRLASDVGRRVPAVVTALGKAMLSALPPEELEHRLARLAALPVPTPRSHRTVAQLGRDIDAIRDRGWAVDDEQNTEGVTCLGIAVPGHRAVPVGVSVTMLSARATPELLGALVADLNHLAAHLS
ncbi:MAG: IclR family transcriptional regulator [Umezawaea sp.]